MEGDEYPISSCCTFISSTCTQKLRDENILLKAQLQELQQATQGKSSGTTRETETETKTEREGQQLENLTNRSRELSSKNQSLREANASCVPNNSGELIKSSSYTALRSNNELMLKQSAELLLGELDEAHNTIRLRDQRVDALALQVSELETALARLSSDKKAAEANALQRIEENNENQKTIDKLRLEVKETRSRMAIEIEEKNELEEECTSLSSKIAVISDRSQDLQAKLSITSQEANTMASNLKKAKRELDVMKGDTEEKEKTIFELKRNLSLAIDQEHDAKEQIREHKEELDNVLISYDKAEAKNKLLQDRVDSLTQERMVETKNVEEFGQLLTALKERHTSEISLRQGSIDELSIENANLASSVQRILREKEDIEKECSQQAQVQENERAKVKESVGTLTDRIAKAEAQLDDANKENQVLCQRQSEMEDRILSLKEELKDERTSCRREKDRAEKGSKELRSMKNKYEDNVLASQRRQSQMETDLQIVTEQHRKRDDDQKAEIIALREKLEEETARYQDLIRHKTTLYIQQEAKLSEEREICHQLLERNKEINRSISILAAEKIDLTRIVAEHEDKIECLSHALKEAEDKIIGIGKELSESIQEQQDRIVKERELRKGLRHIESELDYVKKFGADVASAADTVIVEGT